MKFLKYFLFFIVALVLLFVAVGLVKPSIKYGHEVTVNKSVKEAWAVHQDQSKLGDWLEGFKSIDLISGEHGTVGAKYKVVVNPSENESQPDFEMVETVVGFEEFDHIKLSFDSEVMTFDQTTSFSEANGKTTIKTDSEGKGKGMMMRSMFALMDMFTGSFQAQEVKHMEALKKAIEGNTTNYYPTATPVTEEVINTDN